MCEKTRKKDEICWRKKSNRADIRAMKGFISCLPRSMSEWLSRATLSKLDLSDGEDEVYQKTDDIFTRRELFINF